VSEVVRSLEHFSEPQVRVCDLCLSPFYMKLTSRTCCFDCVEATNDELVPDQKKFENPPAVIRKVILGNPKKLIFKTRLAAQTFLSKVMVLALNGILTEKEAKLLKDLVMAQVGIMRSEVKSDTPAKNKPDAPAMPEELLSEEDVAAAERAGYDSDGQPIPKQTVKIVKPSCERGRERAIEQVLRERGPSPYFQKAPGCRPEVEEVQCPTSPRSPTSSNSSETTSSPQSTSTPPPTSEENP